MKERHYEGWGSLYELDEAKDFRREAGEIGRRVVRQLLSLLAMERRDVQEQLEWKRQILDLLKPLSGVWVGL